MTSKQEVNQYSLAKLYKSFISDVTQVINNPQADPQTAILIFIILLLITGIISLLLWLIISSIRGKKNAVSEVLTAKHFEVTRREVWVTRIAFIAAVFITINAVFYYGSQNSVCKRCHSGSLVKNVSKSTHADARCISCHSNPGVNGYIVRHFDYMRWLGKFTFTKEQRRYDAQVSNQACLRCHGKIAREIVERWGVRVKHTDFLKSGARCVDCHNSVAHGNALAVVKEPTMDKCLMCHNNKQVSASCDLCHTSKASPTTRKTGEEIIRIDMEPMRNCRKCHPQTSKSICIRCHGLELPHPDGWVLGGSNTHARPGFTNKELCKRCHKFDISGIHPPIHTLDESNANKIFCNRCHRYPSAHGPTERWLKLHGSVALGRVESNNTLCRNCHDPNEEKKCSICHSKGMCDSCHEKGMSERQAGN